MSTQNIFKTYWITLSRSEEALFSKFLELFQEYNSHTNLSAIRDEVGVIEKHFADSLILERFSEVRGRILDIGTGGWFPWLPLAIRHPDARFTLLDSVWKKTKACAHFAEMLGLENVECIHARAEELKKNSAYARSFDCVVSRATAYLPQILEWAEPFLNEKGVIVLYKLPSQEELDDGEKTMKKLGLRLVKKEIYALAGQERILLFFSRG